MKKSLRFASAALALTLAAGCAMPAFAAGKSSFSKSETVYAVMNGDGSIKSTPSASTCTAPPALQTSPTRPP